MDVQYVPWMYSMYHEICRQPWLVFLDYLSFQVHVEYLPIFFRKLHLHWGILYLPQCKISQTQTITMHNKTWTLSKSHHCLGTTSGTIFHRNSNLTEISLCSHPRWGRVITMKFCTWHDSCNVMAHRKFCSDTISYNGFTSKVIFHLIWITLEKLFVKLGPGHPVRQCTLDIPLPLFPCHSPKTLHTYVVLKCELCTAQLALEDHIWYVLFLVQTLIHEWHGCTQCNIKCPVAKSRFQLTYWGRVMHTCMSKQCHHRFI